MSSKRIRIAFFLDVMKEEFDGVSNTIHQIVARIPDHIQPIFITPQPPEREFKYPVYECPFFELPFSSKDYRFAKPKRMKSLPMIIGRFKPDIIHFSTPSALGGYAIRLAQRMGVPVTTIYHTHFPSFATYYFRYIPRVELLTEPLIKRLFWQYRESTVVFAPTPSMRDYLIGKGVKAEQLRIWGRGVNMKKFNPDFRDLDFWQDEDRETKKVLFVSRLVKEKEPGTLIRLYRLFQKRRPDIQMVITGDGPTRDSLESNMPNAIFTGKLVGEELSKVYASSDVFVFPSVTETFGNVVLEALASGLPVVAASGGGPRDIIIEGQTGYLVEPQNAEAFYERVVKLLDTPELYASIQKGALKYAKSQSWSKLCNELFRSYEELIGCHEPLTELE